MSNRNFDNRVIIQRLQNQTYSRNLYINNTNGRNLINNPQNSDPNASRLSTYRSGAQTEYFRGLLGNGETISPGGIIGIPPYPPLPPPPPISTGGSMTFNTNPSGDLKYVTYPNNNTLNIGTNDFTIEWYQYWLGYGDFPRVFSIGNYVDNDISIAVSYEGSMYFWINMTPYVIKNTNPPINEWTHMAIVGTSGNEVKCYINGQLETTISSISYDFTDGTTSLVVGNEKDPSITSVNFSGQITNFRWVIGTAVYTSNFIPPATPLTNISGTELLLLSTDELNVVKDSSNENRTPHNSGVIYSSTTPF